MSNTVKCPTQHGDLYVTTYTGPVQDRRKIQLTIDDCFRNLNDEEAVRVANLLLAAVEEIKR